MAKRKRSHKVQVFHKIKQGDGGYFAMVKIGPFPSIEKAVDVSIIVASATENVLGVILGDGNVIDFPAA